MLLVHRYSRVYITWKGHQKELLSWDKAPHNGTFEWTSPFTTGVNPDMNQLTLYNLTKDEFSYFLQDRSIAVTAGFYNADATAKNGGLIVKGTIKSSTPMSLDGVDRSIQVNFNHFPDISEETIKVKKVTKVKVRVKAKVKNTRKKAGGKSATELITAYSKKKTAELNTWLKNNPNATAHQRGIKRKELTRERRKYTTSIRKKATHTSKAKTSKAKYAKQIKYENMSFKKNTTTLTMIKTIAKKAKVPLGAVKLTFNRKYPDSYTVSGKPINAIKKLADGASTTTYIQDGKLYIREITAGQKVKLHLTPETGLLTHPTPTDDGEYDGKKYEAQSLMRQEIYIGALVYVDDGVKNYGKCVVLGGQREYTTSSSTVTFQFVPYSQYQITNAESLKKAKASADKDKAAADLKAKNAKAKDDKRKGKTKSARKKRKNVAKKK